MDTSLLITLLYILFVFSAIVLVVVVLLQEGKGGGFGDALGVAGQQTFGVKASGIHRFTAGVAAVFFITAVTITVLNRTHADTSTLGDSGLLDEPAPAGQPAAPAPQPK
ncbi:MAG: preprotein translocase subunit SecG [Planctomycetes bacterium]|nr:preprotein translocase subunit SecG [Planctomycetota bacterium]MCB9909624.1 preprotein translocase subunit SecG [Planctomycetota bacterium]MCB9911887.1 preprotein translocase subunit SecG [Planctomycetota bacterium]HPF14627.1 preprotein translocase subunit SecG [Planctomycetota bacterium]